MIGRPYSDPLPLPIREGDLSSVVIPDVDGRVFKVRYSRPQPSRACCSTPTGEPVPRFDFVNQPPVVHAGTYAPIYIPNGEFDFVVFDPVVTDDGLPSGMINYLWSVLDGPGAVVFDDPTNPTTAAHFSVAGTYTLQLSANDTEKEGFGTTVITVIHNDPPVVFAGADQSLMLVDGNVDFTSPDATVTDDGVPGPLSSGWSIVSGPDGGAIIDNPADVHTEMHFTIPGTYVLQLDATDSILSATPSQVTITVANEVTTHTVSLRTNGAGAEVSSTPSGFSFSDYRQNGIEDYSHDWDDGTVVTVFFTDSNSTGMAFFKVNGTFTSLVTVTPPAGDGTGGTYSYTLTLTADISLEYASVPTDF